MNSRFEPDGEKIGLWFDNLFKFNDKIYGNTEERKRIKKLLIKK